MTEQERNKKEIELLNKYLGEEARKLSTGQVTKDWGKYGTGRDIKTVLDEISESQEDLNELGKRIQEEIKQFRYLLEEENVPEYLEKVGAILFGNTNVSRPEAEY